MIKKQILVTLEAAKSELVQRNRSFEFLGYDILLDEQLHPWILEANMSPAMAHRSEDQNRLIASMCEGLVHLAIQPWFEDLFPADKAALSIDGDRGYGNYGGWEVLCCEKVAPPKVKEILERDVKQVVLDDWDWRPLRPSSAGPSRSTRTRSSSGSFRGDRGGGGGGGGGGVGMPLEPAWSSSKGGGVTVAVETANDFEESKYREAPSCAANTLQSLEVVGKRISESDMSILDALCIGFARMVLLQR